MKLSDIKGEKAIDICADLLEPVTRMMADSKFQNIYYGKEKKEDGNPYNKLDVVRYMLKEHKKSIIEILAILNDVEYEEYVKEVNVLTLPATLLEILNDKEMNKLFTSQVQSSTTLSVPVTEITQVSEK